MSRHEPENTAGKAEDDDFNWSSNDNRMYNVNTSTSVLQDSELTLPTDASTEEESGWFGTMKTDFRHLANCFKDSTFPVIGGVATFVHKAAMSVAAEIAELERNGELGTEAWRPQGEHDLHALPLPWEIQDQAHESGVPILSTDEDLMDAILALSHREDTFTGPFSPSQHVLPEEGQPKFVLDAAHVTLVSQLLDFDPKLASMHANMIGRNEIQETVFWRNYFHHCDNLRKQHLGHQQSQFVDVPSRCKTDDSTPSSPVETTPVLENSTTLVYGTGVAESVDDSSLVPASVTDDLSYVIPSAPNSLNTFASTSSLGDMVIVDRDWNA